MAIIYIAFECICFKDILNVNIPNTYIILYHSDLDWSEGVDEFPQGKGQVSTVVTD